jgi:hypothetical protein
VERAPLGCRGGRVASWRVRAPSALTLRATSPRPTRSPAGGAGQRPIESAHYAWAKDAERRRQEAEALGIRYAPQPVSVPAAASPVVVGGGSTPGGGASAWNAGGTWEDRDISAKATALLEKAIATIRMAASDGLHLNFTEVRRCEGTATVIYTRGRARPGYEYQLTAKWELVNTADNSLSASGLVELFDIADSDADVFGRMRVGVEFAALGVDRTRCEKVVRDTSDDLRSAIRAWAGMLKTL